MPGLHKKPKGYVSDAQRKAVHASKKDGGKGNPNKPKMLKPKMKNGKTLAQLNAEITRIGKDAINSKNPNERDAALMKKKVLMRERDDMIAKSKSSKEKKGSDTNKPKMKKPMAKFPDLSGDGKVTKKDILMGRGVIDKPKMLMKKKKRFI